jgi:PhzF family phenazine biosynthesis protein
MQVQVKTINAFSINNTGGNAAGVVFDADKFSNETKQAIATAAAFPETAFVSSSSIADFKLDFFTPLKQIPHCGHATIATFTYLKSQGEIVSDHSSKETIDGTRDIEFRNGMAFMEQRAPSFNIPEDDVDAIVSSLNISRNELEPGLLPTIVNTGNSFLMVPVRNEEILAGIHFNRDEVYRISEKFGLIGYYVYTVSDDPSIDATVRMFAPFFGIDEEAATGTAAGPLACFLYQYERINKTNFRIEQGRLMKPASRSLLLVDLEFAEGRIKRLFVGGSAYVSGEKVVEVKD